MYSFFSLLLRKRRYQKEKRKVIRLFESYTSTLRQLPTSNVIAGKTLLIRLDDIGDYVLFRNTIEIWESYTINNNKQLWLLGNEAWRSLYEAYDSAHFTNVIWLNKKKYFSDDDYRNTLWKRLRQQGFDTVICPARTRPILLDDVCMLAAAGRITIANSNSLYLSELNRISDRLYTNLFLLDLSFKHEFLFNVAFANSIANSTFDISLNLKSDKIDSPPYIVLFVGASAASKQWPTVKWNQLILMLQERFKGTIYVAGGDAEQEIATAVVNRTIAQNIAGTKSLPQMATLIDSAQLVISNDTMAAHIAAATGTNTIIIANGTNAYRFTDYDQLSLKSVSSIYSKRYAKLLNKNSAEALQRFSGIRADIQSITVEEVFEQAKGYL